MYVVECVNLDTQSMHACKGNCVKFLNAHYLNVVICRHVSVCTSLTAGIGMSWPFLLW